MEVIKNLSGHSGCSLTLCQDENAVFVRKIAASPKYNIRLKKQCLKQKLFHQDGLSVPEVFSYGYVDDKFYFDMAFLNCTTLSKRIETLSLSKMDKLVAFLMSVLPVNDAKYKNAQPVFEKKIKSLEKYRNENPLYKRAIDKLKRFDFSTVPNTYCYGDLTLENILISNEENLYLIDFLDSFYNSWMIDVAKLLQDIDLHWSYRKEKMSMTLQVRLLILKQKLISAISSLPNGQNNLHTIYHILLLNLMRIVPYIKDEETYDFIQKALTHTFITLDEMEETK